MKYLLLIFLMTGCLLSEKIEYPNVPVPETGRYWFSDDQFDFFGFRISESEDPGYIHEIYMYVISSDGMQCDDLIMVSYSPWIWNDEVKHLSVYPPCSISELFSSEITGIDIFENEIGINLKNGDQKILTKE